jgi:hypothetical protein
MSQESMAKKFGVTQSTIRNVIHKDLGMKSIKKVKVQSLNEFHKHNWKINRRKLYENHLSGDKWQYVVTLDESWVYIDNTGCGSKICYVKRGK